MAKYLNYDGLKYFYAKIKALLEGKANVSHSHNYLPISGGTIESFGSISWQGTDTYLSYDGINFGDSGSSYIYGNYIDIIGASQLNLTSYYNFSIYSAETADIQAGYINILSYNNLILQSAGLMDMKAHNIDIEADAMMISCAGTIEVLDGDIRLHKPTIISTVGCFQNLNPMTINPSGDLLLKSGVTEWIGGNIEIDVVADNKYIRIGTEGSLPRSKRHIEMMYKTYFEEGITINKSPANHSQYAAIVGADEILAFGSNGKNLKQVHDYVQGSVKIPDEESYRYANITYDNAIVELYSNYNYNNGVNFTTSFRPRIDGKASLGMSGRRWGQIWSNVGSITTSDEHTKTDLQYYDTNKEVPEYFTKMMKFYNNLRPMSYRFQKALSGSNRIHMGFGAREIEKIMQKCDITPEEFAGFCKDPVYRNEVYKDVSLGYHNRYEETGDTFITERFRVSLPAYRKNFGYIIFKSNSQKTRQKIDIKGIRFISHDNNAEPLEINIFNAGVCEYDVDTPTIPLVEAKKSEDDTLELIFDRQYMSYTLSLLPGAGDKLDLSDYSDIEIDIEYNDEFIIKLEESGPIKCYDIEGDADDDNEVLDYTYSLRYSEFIGLAVMKTLEQDKRIQELEKKIESLEKAM